MGERVADDKIDGFTYTPTPAEIADGEIFEKVAAQFDGLGETIPISKLGANLFTVSAGIAKALRSAKSLPAMAAEIAYLRTALRAARAELLRKLEEEVRDEDAIARAESEGMVSAN